jgi:hypothetical protein
LKATAFTDSAGRKLVDHFNPWKEKAVAAGELHSKLLNKGYSHIFKVLKEHTTSSVTSQLGGVNPPGDMSKSKSKDADQASNSAFTMEPVGSLTEIDTALQTFTSGHEVLAGSGEKYILAAEWLKSLETSTRIRTIRSCVMFAHKPKKFLTKGKTSKGQSDAKVVDPRIMQFLPKWEGAELSEHVKNLEKRKLQMGEDFVSINFSRLKAIANMACEFNPTTKEYVIASFYRRYGCKPTEIVESNAYLQKVEALTGGDKRHTKVVTEEMGVFASERSFWDLAPIREAFICMST